MLTTSPFCDCTPAVDCGGEKQEPRADFDLGQIGRFEIDVEANPVLLHVESNHSAIREKVIGFADREDWDAAEAPQDCALAAGLGAAQEHDVASLDVLRPGYQAEMKHPGSRGLALDDALEFLATRLVVEDAETEKVVCAIESSDRPVHELHEVEKKCGLDPVLPGDNLGGGMRCHT